MIVLRDKHDIEALQKLINLIDDEKYERRVARHRLRSRVGDRIVDHADCHMLGDRLYCYSFAAILFGSLMLREIDGLPPEMVQAFNRVVIDEPW